MSASEKILDAVCDMREWYRSCRRCLSEAYPEVVTVLDAERTTLTGR